MSEKDLQIKVIDQVGGTHELPALSGWRVMEIIRDHDLPIRAECGGSGACATCHVYVDAQFVSKLVPPDEDEQYMLDSVEGFDATRSRLSCQILMRDDLDGLVVTLAPGSEPS
ncbi:MAG: ferredoxin, 2Fe-2S [Alphaproteobacteria bacterium]|nr:ferredoxin, 2Fe-2S [Alphaproteobacteria bacterium]